MTPVVDVAVPCYGRLPPEVAFSVVALARHRSPGYLLGDVKWRQWAFLDAVRNQFVREALAAPDVTHLMLMDHDHVVPADLVDRLLAVEQEVVGALYFMRVPPYEAVAGGLAPDGHRVSFLGQLPAGPRRIDWCGTGCLLVATRVLRTMRECFNDEVWFKYEGDPGRPDDLWFFGRLRHLDIQVWLDGGTRVGHVTEAVVTDKNWEAYHRR